MNRRELRLALITVTVASYVSFPGLTSLADTLAHNLSSSALSGLMTQTGLSATLRGAGPLAVFAPSNEAFKLVPTKAVEEPTKHLDKLKNILASNDVIQIIESVMILTSKK